VDGKSNEIPAVRELISLLEVEGYVIVADLNCVKTHKQKTGSKLPLSRIMFGCLLDCQKLVHVLMSAEN